MSAATKAAVDDALAAHIADECEGAIITGFVCMTSALAITGAPSPTTIYRTLEAEGQAYHAGFGLCGLLGRWYRIPGLDSDNA